MPNARFKSRTTYIGTPRQPAKARPKRKPVTVDFAGIPGAKPGAMPATLAPQLATLVKAPHPGAGWVHEVKYDVSVPESTFFLSDGGDARVRAPVHEETDDEERCGFDGG